MLGLLASRKRSLSCSQPSRFVVGFRFSTQKKGSGKTVSVCQQAYRNPFPSDSAQFFLLAATGLLASGSIASLRLPGCLATSDRFLKPGSDTSPVTATGSPRNRTVFRDAALRTNAFKIIAVQNNAIATGKYRCRLPLALRYDRASSAEVPTCPNAAPGKNSDFSWKQVHSGHFRAPFGHTSMHSEHFKQSRSGR